LIVLVFGGYCVRVAVKGRYVHDRAKKEPGSLFAGRFLIEFAYWMFAALEKGALALRLTPNQLTGGSMAAALGAALSFAFGNPALGGVLVLVCAILDALDGMVARTRGTASDSGELIDAAVDRYAEIATFAGIAAYYREYATGFWLALCSLGGALLVSYARAKGEISGIDARMGSMNRGERALYVGMAGIIAPDIARWIEPDAARPVFHVLLVILGLIALMANVTAIRRFVFIYKELRSREASKGAPVVAEVHAHHQGWFGRAWVASGAATLVDYGAFVLLVEVLGVFNGTATAIGAFGGAVTNFVINKVWTFRTRQTPVSVEVPRYVAISLASLLFNTTGVVLLADGLKWNPVFARVLVGVLVSVCWNMPLHRWFVFRGELNKERNPALSVVGATTSALAALAVLSMAYGVPFAGEQVHGFSMSLPDAVKVTQQSFLPKLRKEAFYSESYSFLLAGEDGSFARVQFLVSNAGLQGHGKASVRAVVVSPDGTTTEDSESFEPGAWSVRPEGAIELGAHRLTMGFDASHHVHFAGRKLVIDATVLPETQALRPGGGQIVFDPSGHAVFDQTIFALRSKFEATFWSGDRGSKHTRGYCYADTSYSTVPGYKSASLWFRMAAFDEPQAPRPHAAAETEVNPITASKGQLVSAGAPLPTGGIQEADQEALTTALAVLFPPEGSRVPEQGWLYATRGGKTEVRSSDVALTFEHPRVEKGSKGAAGYEVPQKITAHAKGAGGELVTVVLEAKRLLYQQDTLADSSPLARLFGLAGAPVAYTYENRVSVKIERKGQAPIERTGVAITEFAYASRPRGSLL
jgi:phosphatidylglycerophosphate synthase/putative flippase GtrA